ncbi:MAG: nucleotide exchange factor GrpE [Acidimicrobiales bacterium]
MPTGSAPGFPGRVPGGTGPDRTGASSSGAGGPNPGRAEPPDRSAPPSNGADGPGPDGVDPEQPRDEATADPVMVEDLVVDLERVTAERDQFLDASRRLQADMENYRKQVARREVETRERAAESLVVEVLPVLDACDGALSSGATDVEPVRAMLLSVLEKQGLGRIDAVDEPFDPVQHDAVMHEPDESGGADGPMVAEVMRAGYTWNGRVIRPAMVKVRG